MGIAPVNPLRAAQQALEDEKRAGCIPPGTDMGRGPMIDEMDIDTVILNCTLLEEPGQTLNLRGIH